MEVFKDKVATVVDKRTKTGTTDNLRICTVLFMNISPVSLFFLLNAKNLFLAFNLYLRTDLEIETKNTINGLVGLKKGKFHHI